MSTCKCWQLQGQACPYITTFSAHVTWWTLWPHALHCCVLGALWIRVSILVVALVGVVVVVVLLLQNCQSVNTLASSGHPCAQAGCGVVAGKRRHPPESMDWSAAHLLANTAALEVVACNFSLQKKQTKKMHPASDTFVLVGFNSSANYIYVCDG